MTQGTIIGGVSAPQLRSIMERIERLEEEKSRIANDIKDVFAEARGEGFDVKIIRTILKLRKMDKSEFAEQQEILDLYMHALGMIDPEAVAA
jgi:uncharacterized protein (UPF0335 family)